MASLQPLRRSFLFVIPFFFLTSCNLKYTPKTGEDYSQETSHLEKMMQDYGDASVAANSHLQLAWLYAHYKNPKKNYKKALKEFDTYLSLAPDGARIDEIQNWLSILRALERSENDQVKMRERLELLTRENTERKMELEEQMTKIQKMQAHIARLQESNARLKNTIESLKTLDLHIENKRKRVK
jgi:chromosome segregation ATPase